ncbi:MAG: hypothetical protein IIW14_10155, partial [Kiritimatiellae bacterium]|nr:hypothetical protein [Kiritimatiellia bacterium]
TFTRSEAFNQHYRGILRLFDGSCLAKGVPTSDRSVDESMAQERDVIEVRSATVRKSIVIISGVVRFGVCIFVIII